jgi:hypothetical protein
MHGPDVRREALLLLDRGLTISEVSRRTAVSRSTLHEWRTTRGAFAPGVEAKARCLRVDLPAGPYAHLLGLYLGDGCLSLHARAVYNLRIACTAIYPRLIEECSESMAAVGRGRVWRVRAPGCVHVTASSKHWPCLFPQHGPGRKHERPIELLPWQRQIVQDHPGRFVRGLFHSDGCRVINRVVRDVDGQRRRYAYPRYFFSNHSADILGLAEWGLDLLGAGHRRSNSTTVSVARRASVAILDEAVGPKS